MVRKIAAEIVGVFQSNPIALGLVLINLIYLGIGTLIWRETNTYRAHVVDELMHECLDIQRKEGK